MVRGHASGPCLFMPTSYKTYVYVDGFNLYYRALIHTPYKWLDIKKLCSSLIDPRHDIIKIKYFTARVSGKLDPNKPIRQNTYIRAIQTYIPEVEVHFGHFLSHDIYAPLANTTPYKFVKIIKTEEKGSDVNLAVHLLNDAWLNSYDCAIVISNDSDLAESCRLVKEQNKKILGVITPNINPSSNPSHELIKHASFVERIRKSVLAASQLPDLIPGTNIHKPTTW